jgi:hypothetical protein
VIEDALALYRLVRLSTEDELTAPWRDKARSWALDKKRGKLHYFLGCPYCQSLWLAPLVLVLPRRVKRGLAAAGAVALLHDFREWM